MNKKTITWLRAAAILQILTGLIHSIGLFIDVPPANDTEKQLMELMTNYQFDLGAGFHRNTEQLLTGLSSCFSLLYVFAGLLNWFLSKRGSIDIMKGVLNINVFIFGISFAVMFVFTFLMPIVLTCLCFLLLVIARIVTAPKST